MMRRGAQVVMAAMAVVLAILAGSPTAGASAASAAELPLATSVQTDGGTWATVAMGNLDQPLNTFWQLFYEPIGSSSWADKVQATATATNGGLVLGSDGPSLLVGVRPSNELRFSPIIASTDAGRSWSNGVILPGLIAAPAALAVAPGQRTLALVEQGGGYQIDASADGTLSHWQRLVTANKLARQPSITACGLRSLGAIAYDGAVPVVGASCARRGEVGHIELGPLGWSSVGPDLPADEATGPVDVMDISSTGGQVGVVLRVAQPIGPAIVVGWAQAGTSGWVLSPPLALGRSAHVVSVGPTAGGGISVLSARTGSSQLSVLDGPGAGWRGLPPPPPGTATVAFPASGQAQALAVFRTTLQVWRLGSTRWHLDQLLHVPIQFGSSN
jgi:hypothetical protein